MTTIAKRIAMPILYMVLGAVLFVLAFLGWMYYYVSNPPTEQEIRNKYVVEYTRTEQERKGVNCSRLRRDLHGFFSGRFDKALNVRGPGQDWKPLLSQELVTEVSKLREATFTCEGLYLAGRQGTINGLEELSFVSQISPALGLLDTLVRIGPAKKNCDALCVDGMFQELRGAQKTILHHVAERSPAK